MVLWNMTKIHNLTFKLKSTKIILRNTYDYESHIFTEQTSLSYDREIQKTTSCWPMASLTNEQNAQQTFLSPAARDQANLPC